MTETYNHNGNRLLFLLSGNISTTPRALKAVQTALAQGYKVDLCLVNRLPKWKKLDEEILRQLPCCVTYIPLRREEGILSWLISSMTQKGAELLTGLFSNSLKLKAYASSKINYLYHRQFKYIPGEYDMIVGFSGMCYSAWELSHRLNVPFAFDMEDYHPGEVIYHRNKETERARRREMFREILPQAAYISYGSPLIGQNTETLLRKLGATVPAGFPVNNTFPRSDFPEPTPEREKPEKIRFVWFSQTVSFGRGLEQMLPALIKHSDKINLTLIGNLDPDFRASVLAPFEDFIEYVDILPQQELHRTIGKYDIGLALEQPNSDKNRALCLSNKIFTYLLSGLYVLATPTEAQKKLLSEFPAHGIIADNFEDGVETILKNVDSIRASKVDRYRAASALSWEVEEKKLIDIWEKIL